MLGIKRALLCLCQMHRSFELAVYTRHCEQQESLLDLFDIPRVNYRRRRVIARLWGNTYLATYYVTNAQRYARIIHGEDELGTSLYQQTISLQLIDLYPTDGEMMLQSLHYDVSGTIDRVASLTATDCTLLKFKRLSADLTENCCTIYADNKAAIIINY